MARLSRMDKLGDMKPITVARAATAAVAALAVKSPDGQPLIVQRIAAAATS